MANRYKNRTVEWGHWGITFMDVQSDQTKNFGNIIGHIDFPVGNRGPYEGNHKNYYKVICSEWIKNGIKPAGMIVSF